MARIRWPGGGSRKQAFDWAGHERRAGDLVTGLRSVGRPGLLYLREDNQVAMDWMMRVRQLSPEALTSLLLLLIRQVAPHESGSKWALGKVDPRKCVVTDDDAAWALRMAAG